ncbi:glycosyltransferase family 4 protein [Alteromonas sp. ASW11-36]|uniref:Glycosyltransferase family 4 protein n=1 Tax=Alteromonas arenosi TaxID=3055817 RepID=A0ABT7STY1_9ALTE|nr:glycosyltransferase family 4 protein [Alteromonas sp. ASW11-36]MDM7859635.1 glycosyltransferase family 4 protein [Alteromonas sp. ASW11-36]
MTRDSNLPAILCVANWPSDVGYAWWLMESYWAKISQMYAGEFRTILAFPEVNQIPEVIENSPIEVTEYTFAVNNWAGIRRNMQFIRTHNIQVVYFSDYGVAKWAYLAYRLAGVKTIITHDHTPGLRTPVSGWRRFLKSMFVRNRWTGVDAAFGATEFVTRRLIDTACMKPKDCYTVQNGIRLTTEANKEEAQTSHPLVQILPKSRTIIVTAARANHYKGAAFAIDVIAELKTRSLSQPFVYVFCGDGPDLDDFRQRVEERKLQDVCYFPGRVNDIMRFFDFCAIGFQPSQGEVGYSLSIIEYMAAGLPVVVPDNPSVCGATKHDEDGRIYTATSVQQAADALQFYLEAPDKRESHGRQARQRVLNQFTLTATHAALEKAMRAVVKTP